MRNISTRFSPNVQYMHKICARLYLFLQCAIYARDLHKIVLFSLVSNICARFAQDCTYLPNAQYVRKFAQDCTYFPNAQYMRKICARLYLFLQCSIYNQYLCKIVLISPMCNMCTRFAQDYTYFHNAQYMCKIVLVSPMCIICTRLQALLEEICHISHICSKFRMVFTS